MWQGFHTEEPSDPSHEGKLIVSMWRSSQGPVFGLRCMGVRTDTCNVTACFDSVARTCDHVPYQKLVAL